MGDDFAEAVAKLGYIGQRGVSEKATEDTSATGGGNSSNTQPPVSEVKKGGVWCSLLRCAALLT